VGFGATCRWSPEESWEGWVLYGDVVLREGEKEGKRGKEGKKGENLRGVGGGESKTTK
jgi:hypothetical protein